MKKIKAINNDNRPRRPRQERVGLDDTDREILALLQENADRSNVTISAILAKQKKIVLGAAACGLRKERLQKLGYIERITAVISREHIRSNQICFLIVKMDTKTEEATKIFLESAIAEPSILEIYEMQGLCDYLIKVRVTHVGVATTMCNRLRLGIATVDSYSAGNLIKLTSDVDIYQEIK